mmetsp:Transcript_47667/g.119216  ORF Transcript_47667/g.119216 Transcript_47667/m.119216 type:complete len:191 (-) Transcript_47667:617-1189(-)
MCSGLKQLQDTLEMLQCVREDTLTPQQLGRIHAINSQLEPAINAALDEPNGYMAIHPANLVAIQMAYESTKEFYEERLDHVVEKMPRQRRGEPQKITLHGATLEWGLKDPTLRELIRGGRGTAEEKAEAYQIMEEEWGPNTGEKWTDVVYPFPSLLLTNVLRKFHTHRKLCFARRRRPHGRLHLRAVLSR